jgi:hypothetical protein
VDADLDTLATALCVGTDDLLKASPEHAPVRPRVGIAPRLTDAELVTLAVMQALLGRTSEARWLRFAQAQLRHLFPYLPQQSGYNKRLRRLADTIRWLIGVLARDTALWSDDAWVVDSTPVECGRSGRPRTAQSWPAGPSTATAPATPASSGDYACTCCARCTACRSALPSPAPRPTSGRCCSACWRPIPR